MNEAPCRPFYSEYAWAFDLLIDRPVEKECGVIAAWLVGREILPGDGILDAGCGTGRYSRELARRGYVVHGVDLSPELIKVAEETVGDRTGAVSFAVADILVPPTARYAAILCRGILDDIIDDGRRDAAFAAFARALRPNGALILDVREWGTSAERKTREPLFRKRVSTDRGELTFTSVTELDAEQRLLLISERHELVGLGDERVSDYQFVMRCWEREELGMLFARYGFGNIQYLGAYQSQRQAGCHRPPRRRGAALGQFGQTMNLGVLASHEGTTLQSLLDAFAGGRIPGRVSVVVSNNGDSGALVKARRAGVQAVHLSSSTHPDPATLDAAIRDVLVAAGVDVVFLAGYMKKLGPLVIGTFQRRILNTHPALLPRFGGRGMSGDRVFEAVLEAGEVESGVSIHLVDPEYDTGPIVRQCKVPVLRDDSVDDLKARVRAREKEFVVETLAGIAAGDIRLAGAGEPYVGAEAFNRST